MLGLWGTSDLVITYKSLWHIISRYILHMTFGFLLNFLFLFYNNIKTVFKTGSETDSLSSDNLLPFTEYVLSMSLRYLIIIIRRTFIYQHK